MRANGRGKQGNNLILENKEEHILIDNIKLVFIFLVKQLNNTKVLEDLNVL